MQTPNALLGLGSKAFFIVTILCLGASAFAASPSAEEILTHYQAVHEFNDLDADVTVKTQTATGPQIKTYHISIKKPNKVKMDFSASGGPVMISDGQGTTIRYKDGHSKRLGNPKSPVKTSDPAGDLTQGGWSRLSSNFRIQIDPKNSEPANDMYLVHMVPNGKSFFSKVDYVINHRTGQKISEVRYAKDGTKARETKIIQEKLFNGEIYYPTVARNYSYLHGVTVTTDVNFDNVVINGGLNDNIFKP